MIEFHRCIFSDFNSTDVYEFSSNSTQSAIADNLFYARYWKRNGCWVKKAPSSRFSIKPKCLPFVVKNPLTRIIQVGMWVSSLPTKTKSFCMRHFLWKILLLETTLPFSVITDFQTSPLTVWNEIRKSLERFSLDKLYSFQSPTGCPKAKCQTLYHLFGRL